MLAACADGPGEAPAETPDETPEKAPATEEPSGPQEPESPPAEQPGTEDAGQEAAPVPGEATTGHSEDDGDPGGHLTVTDVRVGTHGDFDRVTFELAGEAEAGWFVELPDEARAQGSGHPVEVAGEHVLGVALRNVSLPPDLPDELAAYEGPDRIAAPDGARLMTEVVEDTVFEGHHTYFVGADEPIAYRIERLDDPQRVVLDLVPDA